MRTQHFALYCLAWLIGLLAVSIAPARAADSLALEYGAGQQGDCRDELWIVSTRHLECPCSERQTDPTFEAFRYDASGEWRSAAVDDLLADDQPAVTAIYVHGNRIDADEVEWSALQAYQFLRCSGVPTRVVFWSWPSDRIHGQLRDVRYKMHRSTCEAYHLARFLSWYPSTDRFVLIGFSLGGRIIGGAAHLLAGGSLEAGPLFDYQEPRGTGLAVTLMAAAVENCAFCPEGRFSLAASQIDEFQNLYNSLDPVLKRFWLTDPVDRPVALGYAGTPVSCQDSGTEYQEIDLRSEIGRVHRFRYYFNSSCVVNLVQQQIRGRFELSGRDLPLSVEESTVRLND